MSTVRRACDTLEMPPLHVSPGVPTVPATPCLERPPAEQAQMRARRRRTRDGSLRASHLFLRCVAGRTPTEMAACLVCSRASGSHSVRAYRPGSLGSGVDQEGPCASAVQTTVLLPGMTRSLGA